MSWIYVIAVIIFALVSQFNKTSKNKNRKGPRGAMPPFGSGPGEGPLRRQGSGLPDRGGKAESQGSGFPAPVPSAQQAERTDEGREPGMAPAFPEPALFPTPDYETGEGASLEQPEEEDGVEVRQERMRRELERVHRALDRISSDMDSGGIGQDSAARSASAASASKLPSLDGDPRSGLVWAEILGPPRSRRSMNSRRP
ncbi:hypothetical protein G5B47_05270 [Paenibacillus sp. 7124]|uniref:Uncharacterized protein n=1 Tax=Paenibacillus apii TaxID=1850370 RepID=A0A6M1PF99_9BACL|nr:hypothetical protein [Paenibacillus apii]NGM81816.1 hypothetical protein [Paenibacillus apii]NJJ41025.1 hypothetical protein [Paenibacillus apii]